MEKIEMPFGLSFAWGKYGFEKIEVTSTKLYIGSNNIISYKWFGMAIVINCNGDVCLEYKSILDHKMIKLLNKTINWYKKQLKDMEVK